MKEDKGAVYFAELLAAKPNREFGDPATSKIDAQYGFKPLKCG